MKFSPRILIFSSLSPLSTPTSHFYRTLLPSTTLLSLSHTLHTFHSKKSKNFRFFSTNSSNASAKDFYGILGASRSDTKEDIKKKFRKLAKQYHPDTNKDPDAHTKFQEINEAYECLSNDNDRKIYDQYGHANYKAAKSSGADPSQHHNYQNFSQGFNMNDIFSEFFGGNGGNFGFGNASAKGNNSFHYNRPRQGETVHLNVQVGFMDAVNGIKKKVKYPRKVSCESCSGSGIKNNSTPEVDKCKSCNGTGMKQKVVNGFMFMQQTCEVCHGTGGSIKNVCGDCHGEGLKPTQGEIDIEIPAGIDSDMQMSFPGYGDFGQNKGPGGDLVVHFSVQGQTDSLKRKKSDVYSEVELSLAESVLGTNVEVNTVQGNVDLKVAEFTKHNETVRLKGKGIRKLTSRSSHSGFGDHFVTFKVKLPSSLSQRQKELLKEFEEEEKRKQSNTSRRERTREKESAASSN